MRNPAIADIVEGLRQWPLWGHLGVMEVRRRYRRTVLGPFWASLSLAILVGAMGVTFSTLWNMKISDYLPFVATGFMTWLPIAAMVTESATAFTSAEAILRQVRQAYSLFICIVVWRNIVVFGHHLAVYVIVVVAFSVPVNWNTPLFIPGLFFVAINGLWVGLLVAALTTRYRDVQPMTASVLQILLFVTPIFWPPELLARRGAIFVDANLFYHFVAIVRQPLLGQAPPLLSWYVVAATTVVGWAVTIIVLSRIRARLPYWL